MSEWILTTLDSICEIVRGGSPRPIIKFITTGEGGFNWIKIGDVSAGTKYITKSKEKIIPEGGAFSREVLEGDLILSNSMSYGRPYILQINGFIHDGWLRLRNDKDRLNKEFFYYFLSSSIAQNQLDAAATGSVVNNLKTDIVKSVIINLPPLAEQEAIAEVLSSLDDKIDLFTRQNKTLEALAQTYFRQWFIEEANDDWEATSLGNILSVIESGSRPKGGIDPNKQAGIPSVGAESINGLGIYDFSKTKYISKKFYDNMKRGKVQSHDVLIYKDGAYIGKKGMFGNDFPFKEFAVNEHVFILRTNEKANQIFLYFLLNEHELAQLNSNSAQPGLNQASMKSFEITLPPLCLIKRFEEKINPLVTKVFHNAKQIQTLQKLRDTLLPKLISGEVKVKH